jgi:hypothetical protein
VTSVLLSFQLKTFSIALWTYFSIFARFLYLFDSQHQLLYLLCVFQGKSTETSETLTAAILNDESEFPFPVEADDHCESPATAYQDIMPLLEKFECIHYSQNKKISGDKNHRNDQSFQLRIYDPYYCDGAVKRNLAEIGFVNVHHEKEDCYQVWEDSVRYPRFDVLITNPPYSEDHIEKLIHHLTSSNFARHQKNDEKHIVAPAAWFLLLPTWVHKKDFYIQAMAQADIQPFYLVPRKRYVYVPPTNFRSAKKSDVHKKSSPFTSMWFCWGGNRNIQEQLIRHYHQHDMSSQRSPPSCDFARNKNALRDLRRKKR